MILDGLGRRMLFFDGAMGTLPIATTASESTY